MHQIWYTKYTTCTGRMASVQKSIRPGQDVWLTYKAYSPCTPSIPYVSTVIYGYTGRILHCTLAIRQGQVVYLVNQITDDTKGILGEHGLYAVYVSHTSCTRRMLHFTFAIRQVQVTKFGTRSIRPVPDVWLTYNEVYDLYRTYG